MTIILLEETEGMDGLLIAVEGIDGSGKTTLCEYLKEKIESFGRVACVIRSGGENPNDVEFQLRKIVVDENSNVSTNAETLIYFASLAQKVEKHILPSLKNRNVVIVDRFVLSAYVFSTYMFSHDAVISNYLTQFSSRQIIPDFTFLCDLDVGIAYQRMLLSRSDLTRREKTGMPMMQNMREGFQRELHKFTQKYEIIRTDLIPLDRMEGCFDVLKQFL